MGSRVNRFVFFEIFFFIFYMVVCFIPEYIVGRKLKGLLVFSSLSLSIIFSLIVIIYMLMKRKIIYKKIVIASVPIIYLIAQIISAFYL